MSQYLRGNRKSSVKVGSPMVTDERLSPGSMFGGSGARVADANRMVSRRRRQLLSGTGSRAKPSTHGPAATFTQDAARGLVAQPSFSSAEVDARSRRVVAIAVGQGGRTGRAAELSPQAFGEGYSWRKPLAACYAVASSAMSQPGKTSTAG